MKTHVKIEGMDKLQKQMDKVARSLGPDAVEPIAYESAQMITEGVQANVNRIRKVTGNLSRSPVTKKLDRRGDNPAPSIAAIDRRIAPHAGLIEHGTSRAPARPYFRPAVDNRGPAAAKHLENGLRRLVEGATK